MITGFGEVQDTGLVTYSPNTLRKTLEDCIKVVGMYKGTIRIKVNAISDNHIESVIYDAGAAGANVKIICRGACSLIPDIDNIEIHSVVGRFLEHSRIYIFDWHDPNEDKDFQIVFISSADLLTRNLDKRIEVMAHIKSAKCAKKLTEIFDLYWDDVQNTYRLDPADGQWKKLDGEGLNAQNQLTL